MNRDLLVVVGYIMHYDYLEKTINGSFFSKIDKAIELAEQFVELYPEDYDWVEGGWELEILTS